MRSMFGVSPDHQAAVVTARLHPADVVAHDVPLAGFHSFNAILRINKHQPQSSSVTFRMDGVIPAVFSGGSAIHPE